MIKKIFLSLLISISFFMGITYLYAQEENNMEGEDKSSEIVAVEQDYQIPTPAADHDSQVTTPQTNSSVVTNSEESNATLESHNDESQIVNDTSPDESQQLTSQINDDNHSDDNEAVVTNTQTATGNQNEDISNNNDEENYNVSFHYLNYKFTMRGGSSFLLSKLIHKFDLDLNINDIKTIKSSNFSVISIIKTGNDYTIKSLKPFYTEEKITIYTKDDRTIIINLTDPVAAPAHDKLLSDNGDGTYTLELTVTGDADNVQQASGDVDFILVYDVSSSMNTSDVEVNNRNYTRADQAEDVVHDFLSNLAGYQNDEGNNIRVSLVNFAKSATQIQGWSTDITGMANRFDDGGTDGRVNFGYTGNDHNGTNWERALQLAQALVETAREGVPTFVLLFTDGAPTASGTTGSNAIAPTGASMSDLRNRYNAATDEAYAIAQAVIPNNGMFFGIYAYGDTEREADLLDDLMYYSMNGQHRGGSINNVIRDTEEAPNYAFAGDPSAVQTAVNKVFDKMVQALGISSVSITDGTTNNVETNSGRIAELLEVDTTSYEYWISIPVVNNTFTRVDRNDNTITYTVNCSNNNCTVTWNGNSVSVQGSISGGEFKYKWTSANDLYDYDAPAAQFTNGAVNWNLSSVGTLLDGVTYSVTFRVYPSQETLDYVADIKNNPGENGAWSTLDPEIQKYIDVDGNLKTNTTATLTFTDTRTGESGDATYENPDPVPTNAVEAIAVTKVWENEIDGRSQDAITLTVTCDGEEKYTIDLSDDNSWTDTVFVSIGIIDKDGNVLSGAEGHDFTFTEPDNLSYHWELDVPVVHPMLINGAVTMLIKVDEKHPAPAGADTYVINGSTYYVDEAAVALTATNDRRSRLFLSKIVTGENAPEDAIFPFVVNVVNSKAPATEPENDPNHESDYWVWVSVFDADGNGINEGVTGATSYGEGYWYAPSGTDITIPVQVGYSILINNLPTGTTYTITEGTLPTGFAYSQTDLVIDGDGTDSTFNGARTTTGTIESTNTVYTVEYTNEYVLIDVTVNKYWDDNSDQDGIRPDDLTLTLNGVPEGTTVSDPEITVSSDGNTWTYTWADMPKYDSNGEEIEYTITEGSVPAGYTCTTTTVAAGGTITNTHVPETTTVTVNKVWVGDPTQDGKTQPTSVQVILKADGTPVGNAITLNAGNRWNYTWSDLDKYADGEEITYTIEEVTTDFILTTETPGTYHVTYNGNTITNTYITEKTTVTVNKVWKGDPTQDGKTQPTSVQVILKADGTPVGDPVTLDEDGNWSYTWTNLEKNKDGKEIEYTVEEVETDLITLKETEGAYHISIDGYTITNTYIPVTRDIYVKKVWDDKDNYEGLRTDSVTINLYANGDLVDSVTLSEDNNWEHTWTGLAYNEDGEEIEYTIDENKVKGYDTTILGSAEEGFQVINTHSGTGGDVPENPNTGDNVLTYIAMMIISIFGLLTFSIKFVKNN